jgi:hypothetical protein
MKLRSLIAARLASAPMRRSAEGFSWHQSWTFWMAGIAENCARSRVETRAWPPERSRSRTR